MNKLKITISIKILIISVIAGSLAVLIGVFELASTFKYFMKIKGISGKPISAWSLSKMGLILCEVIVNLLFCVIIVTCISIKDKIKNSLILVFGGLRILTVILMLVLFWKPGWYFVLDPNGSHKASIVMIVFSFIQGLTLLFPLTQLFLDDE